MWDRYGRKDNIDVLLLINFLLSFSFHMQLSDDFYFQPISIQSYDVHQVTPVKLLPLKA